MHTFARAAERKSRVALSDTGLIPDPAALNPQGLMPLLATPDMGNIPESDTIARHLLDRFSAKEPSFVPSTLAGRAKSDTISRLHDMYLSELCNTV